MTDIHTVIMQIWAGKPFSGTNEKPAWVNRANAAPFYCDTAALRHPGAEDEAQF